MCIFPFDLTLLLLTLLLLQSKLIQSLPTVEESPKTLSRRYTLGWLNNFSPVGTVGSNEMPATLGAACPFIVTGKTGISTIAPSNIFGDIGVAPIAITAITGFSMPAGVGPTPANQLKGFSAFPGLTSLVSKAWAPETGSTNAQPNSPKAVLAASNAYTTLSNLATGPPAGVTNSQIYKEFQGGKLGDKTILLPGVYRWTTTVVIPVGATVTLSGKCGDVFVLISSGAISTGASSTIQLGSSSDSANQLTAASVFWVGATSITTGVSSHFAGIILTYTNVVIGTNAFLVGMIYAQTEVALQQATINRPTSCTIPTTGFIFSLECDDKVLNGLQAPTTTPPSTMCIPKDTRLNAGFCKTLLNSAYANYIAAKATYDNLCSASLVPIVCS